MKVFAALLKESFGRVPLQSLNAILFITFAGLASSACRSIPAKRADPGAAPDKTSHCTNILIAVTTHTPNHPHEFSVCQKLNPLWWFQNVDEPNAPAWYRPGEHCRNFTWHCRNSFHNFDCYVIGLTDKHFTRIGSYPEDNFRPGGGWNWAVCQYRWLRLPFISYAKNKFRFYFGWREAGAFGIELKFGATKLEARKSSP
jgi:hypothetical protein